MTLYLAVAQIHPVCQSPTFTEYDKSLSSLETLLSVLFLTRTILHKTSTETYHINFDSSDTLAS